MTALDAELPDLGSCGILKVNPLHTTSHIQQRMKAQSPAKIEAAHRPVNEYQSNASCEVQ